jgi:L-amino acid N-acyltransferase YncA
VALREFYAGVASENAGSLGCVETTGFALIDT